MSRGGHENWPTAHIRFETWEAFGAFVGQQASSRGLFVRTDLPPAIGTELRVRFVLPDGSDMHLPGRVVHTVNPLEAEALGEDPGMGVQFTQMSEDEARALQAVMAKALSAPNPDPEIDSRDTMPVSKPPPSMRPDRVREQSHPPRRTSVTPETDPRLHEATQLLDRSRFDAAERKVAEVLRERPQSPAARSILLLAQARRAASQFDFGTAIEKYRALLTLDSDNIEAKSQLALLPREAQTSRMLSERVFGPAKRSS